MKSKIQVGIVVLSFLFVAMNASALSIPGTKSLDASVAPTGGVQEWGAVLENISGGAASLVSWSGVIAGSDTYKVANQHVEVTANVTNAVNWRMIIYTNNATYTGDKSKGGYGLLGADVSKGLPLIWRVEEDPYASSGAVPAPVFSLSRTDDTEGFADFVWRFVVDQTQTGTWGWNATDTYVRVWDNDGFYWGEGGNHDQSLDDKVYIYFASGFHQSLAQQYSTTSLTLEILVL